MVARHSFVGRGEGGGKLQLSCVERKESKCALPSHSPPLPLPFLLFSLTPLLVAGLDLHFHLSSSASGSNSTAKWKNLSILSALGVFKKKISSFFFFKGHGVNSWSSYHQLVCLFHHFARSSSLGVKRRVYLLISYIFWTLALRFHNWESLDLSMFMSAAPLLSGSILGSKDLNRSSCEYNFVFQLYSGIFLIQYLSRTWFIGHILHCLCINVVYWLVCEYPIIRMFSHSWPFLVLKCGLNSVRT